MQAPVIYLLAILPIPRCMHVAQLLKIGTVDSSGSGELHDFLAPVIFF
jgi:hypothetical protein